MRGFSISYIVGYINTTNTNFEEICIKETFEKIPNNGKICMIVQSPVIPIITVHCQNNGKICLSAG